MGELAIESTEGEGQPIPHTFREIMQLAPGAETLVRPTGMPAGSIHRVETASQATEAKLPHTPSRIIRVLGKAADVFIGPDQTKNDGGVP